MSSAGPSTTTSRTTGAPIPSLPSLSSNPKLAPIQANVYPPDPSTSAQHQPYYAAPPTSFLGLTSSPFPRSTSESSVRSDPLRTSDVGHGPFNGVAGGLGDREAGQGGAAAVHKYGLTVSQSQASAAATEWELAYEREREERWEAKVKDDLEGWRGGKGIKRSEYSRQALPSQSYYHQPVTGDIKRHLPKEVVRIERDWSDGEVCQFETSFPMELDERISPAQFTSLITTLNTHLIAAYSVRGAVVDNVIAIATWWTSLIWRTSTFEKHLQALENEIRIANERIFNPAGLNVLSPRDVALQFLEIE